MSQSAAPLNIRNLSKRYGDAIAIDNVSLEIRGDSFYSLLGPSGSGKTSLLMAIAGFVVPDSGSILVGEREITALPPEKRNFGMVFQGYALFPNMTVAQNVAFPLAVRRMGRAERDEKVRRVLDTVQLGSFAERMPRQLSGGQQQRVALARALVFEPDILLLDEPLSALDKKLRVGLQAELRELQRRVGKTFVCVTHDQEEALSMSDEIAIVRHGKITQSGQPAALFEKPATYFVADFLGDSNFIEGTALGQASDGSLRYETGGTPLVQANAKASVGEKIMLALRPFKVAMALNEPKESVNRLPGQLLRWSYRGSDVQYEVDTPLGIVSVNAPTWLATIAPTKGQKVWLSWTPDAPVVVKDDRAA